MIMKHNVFSNGDTLYVFGLSNPFKLQVNANLFFDCRSNYQVWKEWGDHSISM